MPILHGRVLWLLRRLWRTWAAWLFITVWLLVGWYLAFQQHAAFHTHLFDTGYYTQVLWNTSRGNWFENSLKYPTFLADHFSPALLLLTPLFWISASSYPLQFVKIAALGLPVLPLYWLLRQKHPTIAPFLVLAYILNPLLHQTALEEFHEIMLAALPISVACYALRLDRLKLLAVSLGLLLLVREDMAIYVTIFGMYVACFCGARRKLGVAIMVVGLAWFAAMTLIVMPWLRSGTNEVLGGAQASTQIIAALRDPIGLLEGMLTRPKGWAVVALLLPLAGLPLFARGEQLLWGGITLYLIALPVSDVGGLSDWYVAPLIPLVWYGATIALRQRSGRVAFFGTCALLIWSGICFYRWSPFPGGKQFIPAEYVVTDHHRIGHSVLAKIPTDASVVTQSGLGAHLAARRQIALYPWNQPRNEPQIWVFDTQNADMYPLTSDEFWAAIEALRREPTVSLLTEKDGFVVFAVDGNTQLNVAPPE